VGEGVGIKIGLSRELKKDGKKQVMAIPLIFVTEATRTQILSRVVSMSSIAAEPVDHFNPPKDAVAGDR
jgi:hypothetical protein